ncbi:uncharacterized protein LOC143635025 [Bidens hawaiensis]|uniref:uncharacterized protein LOC143635025 n=1 Tax=Bidens hawaiensis TaxID=980011 RepID=UPI00404AF582
MRKDAMVYAQKCDSCEKYNNIPHQPHEHIHPIVSPWPFIKSGMDIVGKLLKTQGDKVFMLAVTDYIFEWTEVEAFTQVKEQEVISFIKRNILTSFGIPADIICDNVPESLANELLTFVQIKLHKKCNKENSFLFSNWVRGDDSD